MKNNFVLYGRKCQKKLFSMVKHASYTVDRNVKESLEDNYKKKKKTQQLA